MYYQLSRLGMCAIKTKNHNAQLGGSSKFSCGNNKIFLKEVGKNPNADKPLPTTINTEKITEKEPKLYGLRKTKIRQKILNFFNLDASKKFCAFYSISFPVEISDEIGYKVLNTWLTRCRKSLGLKSYLWVAERQKNGTLHFHLITHNYMPIKIANEFMKTALKTQWEKGNLNCRLEVLERYNGVDVDNLYHSKRQKNQSKKLPKTAAQKKLSYYLTKYISKNQTKSNRLPWHCSRDISALFISINYADVSNLEIANLIADNPDAVTTYDQQYFTMYYFRWLPEDYHFKDLYLANEVVFKKMHQN